MAEAVLDLKQHIVWQASAADIARVKQVYLPLKHARKVLMMPDVPVQVRRPPLRMPGTVGPVAGRRGGQNAWQGQWTGCIVGLCKARFCG